MSRWSHGHSLAAGVVGGLLIGRHTLLFMVLAFAAGLLADRGVRSMRSLAGYVKARSTVAS